MLKKIRERLKEFRAYIYDTSIDIKERTFILFSVTVLIALFAAISCGLIMREPLSATISTLAGTLLFSFLVSFAYRKNKIREVKVILSIIVVFIFLPMMFFTNGGVEGGTPVWLLLGTIYIALILDGTFKRVMITLNAVVMVACFVIGYFHPEIVSQYDRGANFFDTIAALFIISGIVYTLFTFQRNLLQREEKQKSIQRLFEQTAIALVNAIDAKDVYTHGHSSRVADYSKMIAKMSGMSSSECEEIYYVALLHDVGKIGISEDIINKAGKLTDEEYSIIKQHPVLGSQILHSITEYPNLEVGALGHHERFDGKGYPYGLKGPDIPVFARIISVADAYDAMTSRRSYRDPIPQQKVREEFVKGSGTQFDPEFARIMIHLIDIDTEYDMKEKVNKTELSGKEQLDVDEYRSSFSQGILVGQCMSTIRIKVKALDTGKPSRPVMILFDSLDGNIHTKENEVEDLMYFEYGVLGFDGSVDASGCRKSEVREGRSDLSAELREGEYTVEAVKIKDHALIRVISREKVSEVILALCDTTRYMYIGLSGENCQIYDLTIENSEEKCMPGYIPRIAEEISFINVPAGDIPNVQLDGYRSDCTAGLPVMNGMKIKFHTKSLPTARLVWHCPFINLFTSDDGLIGGPNYRDLLLMRLDGECWESDPACSVEEIINYNKDFAGWDAWKKYNKEGFECEVLFERHDNQIVIFTENFGLYVKSIFTIDDDTDRVYVSLTGDQCAITNIRIDRE